MATNYLHDGVVLDWTNGTGSDVASGAVVVIGNILGVALVDIADTATGSVQIQGVFTLPKVSAAVIAAGETLVYDVSAGEFDDDQATLAAGDVSGAAAIATVAAGSGVTTLAVKLTGVPGTVT